MSMSPDCAPSSAERARELAFFSNRLAGAGSSRRAELVVPSMKCGACMRRVEMALSTLPGVRQARVNLSTKRVTVEWTDTDHPPALIETLERIGFQAHAAELADKEHDAELSALLRALAVAAFASSNIMLLSFAVWFGADPQTRQYFHLLSGLIALPAVLYSGQVFYRSAWTAVRHGRTNMDVPISIGVTLTFGLSLWETMQHGPHAYFDAAVSLLFFLLIGRTLDHMMRARARSAVAGIARLASPCATVIALDGTQRVVPLEEVMPGMVLAIARGQRVPVDAQIIGGTSEADCSLVSGESAPVVVSTGDQLQAGVLNLAAPLTMRVLRPSNQSFLAEMTRMMEAAESGRGLYRRIADRAAALYAPVVHAAAALTLLGWLAMGSDLHQALTTAIAVLIITCPCALGLAVPMVQVVAAGRLFRNGILIKDGSSLERLCEIDTVVFDKTGTLTTGVPELIWPEAEKQDQGNPLSVAAGMASHSSHPYSRAIIAACPQRVAIGAEAVTEQVGYGLESRIEGIVYRLGRPGWAAPSHVVAADVSVILSRNGEPLASFRFRDRLREGAVEAIADLKARGLAVELLSGDRASAVADLAGRLGLVYRAEATPSDKVRRLEELKQQGRTVLMVGDGLNDAAALASAYVSIAPASASDVGRTAADLIFLHESLAAIPLAHRIAVSSARLIRQNFVLSLAYNAMAVPVAVAGFLTPLLAAIAMSSSSLVVVLNALRLAGAPEKEKSRG
ncbi:MAG: cadmium-translocating P-type ATPase [Alphaproteobacteria bacterium]|nr:cadmium-translocating P-type ATPase [Alphaproteobacteria bacterium]MBU1549158.1 cadmium-translocating P-type ATPase [Alphaproteobacteria bacterium]MBU2337033.1 cadmium-translocating P-type ATPase [Alphaproteobacteria bacterium]MBU2388939.1 cadmium-translocating P-type ATPase [Alphaproteobacteria bacterium]